jgi:intracellular septation protein A
VVLGLVRGALPALAVATLIPLVLFYAAMLLGSVDIAIGVSLAYAYGMGLWQLLRQRRVSGMLMVTMFTVTVKVLAVAASGQPFYYFLAPVIETGGFGLLFVISLVTRESLIVRLARDLVPSVAEDLAERARVCQALSVIWALTYLCSGTTTFVLLVTQPLDVYVGVHQITGWMCNGLGLTASLLLCRWKAPGLLALVRERFTAPVATAAAASGPDTAPVLGPLVEPVLAPLAL